MPEQPDTTPSGRGHGPTEKGGVPVGRRVRLPRGAQPPIRVYINGIQQKQGVDYELQRGEIVFREPIMKEGKISGIRKLTLGLGVVGVYRKNETVDIEYRRDGRTELASNVAVIPD